MANSHALQRIVNRPIRRTDRLLLHSTVLLLVVAAALAAIAA